MLFYQVIMLALIQGITEFLPISSSAHLILPAQLLEWPDQGLAFDLAVHLGTLFAVLVYLRREVSGIAIACLSYPLERKMTEEVRLGFLIVLGTLPAVCIGFFIKDYVEHNLRSVLVIALASIGFGILLAWADIAAKVRRSLQQMSLPHGIYIGFAQALAFIPGTSRSGITITAALFLGYERQDALRFSFLLSIPLILAASLLCVLDLLEAGVSLLIWRDMGLGIVISGFSAYICMHLFMNWVNRVGMMPFVVYRVLLGLVLLWFYFQV